MLLRGKRGSVFKTKKLNKLLILKDCLSKHWIQLICSFVKILCSQLPHKMYWEWVDFNKAPGQQMKNAIKGGFQEQPSFDLYVGRIMQEGEWKISKVVDMNHQDKGIWVWTDNGGSARYYQFELLKANYTSAVSCYNWNFDTRSHKSSSSL